MKINAIKTTEGGLTHSLLNDWHGRSGFSTAPDYICEGPRRAKKEEDRIANSSTVMAESSNVRRQYPRDLLDKADGGVVMALGW